MFKTATERPPVVELRILGSNSSRARKSVVKILCLGNPDAASTRPAFLYTIMRGKNEVSNGARLHCECKVSGERSET